MDMSGMPLAGGSPTPMEIANYVREMASELATMARGSGAKELANMLEMATLEAEHVIQTSAERRGLDETPRTH
jgi:hypothetical protein